MELWKDIKGYEGLYQVSSFGRVKSLARKTNNQYGKEDRILNQYSSCGYLFAVLSVNGKRDKQLVHRLVAEAFIPNPNNYPCVNHKDETKTNNRVENLEWCSVSYNIHYGTRTEKVIEKMSKSVKQIDRNTGEIIATFSSSVEAERATGISSQNIGKCCSGNLPSAGGYVWSH